LRQGDEGLIYPVRMKTFFILILLALSACGGLAQAPLPSGNTNEMLVALWFPHAGDFHAPATINLQAYVRVRGSGLKAGDVANVEFFANSKSLGSVKAVWHDVIRPHAPPGSPVPMWVRPAGFDPAKWTWKNVVAGSYSITAQAICTNGLSAVSRPMTVTVLP
jgi:hypothetical protein